MIDWLNVFYNALWIFALALALAAISHASWQASENKTRLRKELAGYGVQLSLSAAGILFSAGLALTSEPAWQRILWAVLALLFSYQTILILIDRRKSPPTP